MGTAAVIAMAAGAALIAGSLSSTTPDAAAGSGSSTGGVTRLSNGSAAGTPSAAPRCRAAALTVWVGVGSGGAAAGSSYLPLELTNHSRRACSLHGYPGASARSDRQLGSAAGRSPAVPERTVTLAAGATAHAVLQLVDVANFAPGTCAPARASSLRVYPPGGVRAVDVPFRLAACSKTGPTYLTVTPVEAGVGVPGQA
jgi:hypothetical protein